MVMVLVRNGKPLISARELQNDDWMRELDHDARHIQEVLCSLDAQVEMAEQNLKVRNYTDAKIRLNQVREGLRLVAGLMGIKIA